MNSKLGKIVQNWGEELKEWYIFLLYLDTLNYLICMRVARALREKRVREKEEW